MHRLPFPTEGRERAKNVGDLVHGDLGMVSIPTPERHKYYSFLKDDFSEYTDTKILKKKSDVSNHVVEFCKKIKTQTGRLVKVIRTDQGTEYRRGHFDNWKRESGIIHQTTCRYNPQQNGVSGRANRTLMDGVRSSMYDVTNNKRPNTSIAVQEL